MTRTSKYLNQDTIAAIQSFQIEKIDREITDYLDTNNKMNMYHFEYCPKCGCYHHRLIRSGFVNSGKQMLRCKKCGKRFVVDHGQLTFYSHQDRFKWYELILDTLNSVSLKETAAKINVNECNVFNMRNKLLVSLGTEEHPNEVEMDEKYTPYNHKGTKIDGIESKLRGTPATKRCLSNQQICIITATQRFGHTIARTLNYGKLSSIDLLRFGECLESKSFVMLDGSNSYNELLESKNCTKKVLLSHESYDKFNHLKTVNSFHKLIEERLQKYKGVASKYINRYNALFVMQRKRKEWIIQKSYNTYYLD